MARKVIWTATAWSDLEAVAEYIAKDSTHYAATVVSQSRNAARSLTHLSERGRVVPELNDLSIRELFVGNYRLIYPLTDGLTYIIGFIHGARDLWALWEQDKR